MVSWWKRLLFSLASVFAAVTVICTVADILGGIVFPSAGFNIGELPTNVVDFLFFALPGWLFAVPIVLVVTSTQGWRFWMYWAIGSGFGPVVILGMEIYSNLTSPAPESSAPGSIAFMYFLAAVVSSLTTLIYLLSLRLAQRQPWQPATKPSTPAP